MKSVLVAAVALAALASPAQATTVANGVVIFNHADVMAGGITPGDTAGYPATLSLAGTYRLSGNLAPPADKDGINVTAPEVTIDLFGFRMAGGGTAASGIKTTQRALTVTNGTIRGFSAYGIYAIDQFLVSNMRIVANDYGIWEEQHDGDAQLLGSAIVRDSEVLGNSAFGIVCRSACHVESNNISRNGTGLFISRGLVIGNTFVANGKGMRVIGSSGAGSNAFIGNQDSIDGQYTPLNPNYCSPAC